MLLEPFFMLGYYFGMDWQTFYGFPLSYRRWLLKRVETEIQKASGTNNIQTKGAHHNTPEARSLTGKFRKVGANVGAHQRFT